VQNAIGFYLAHSVPAWQTFMAIPEHQELARALALRSRRPADEGGTSPIFSTTCPRVFGRIVPDGRIRLFDRLVSVASFPIGIDVADFAKAKRAGGSCRAVLGRSHHRRRPLDYTKGLPQKFKAFGGSWRNIRSISGRWF